MALIYDQATVTPEKIELLTAWVCTQPWAAGLDTSRLEQVGAFRFDDPAGEVGIETHLVRTVDGRLLQVPLTYRSSLLTGADAALVGTTEHSVLGTRWVYDGCADPVYAAALAATILSGGHEAELEIDGRDERRRGDTRVTGSGAAPATLPPVGDIAYATQGSRTLIRAGDLELVVLRVVPDWVQVSAGAQTLTGTWPGSAEPRVLAAAG